MKKIFSKLAIAALVAGSLLGAHEAQAIPSLQLDTNPGVFNNSTETTVATSDVFRLYAYLQPDGNKTKLTDTYYISAAVIPSLEKTNPAPSLGSFLFDTTSIDVTGGMVYGTPPMNDPAGQDADPGDLASHSIFDTYFTQFQFQFNPLQTIAAYNVQDDSPASGSMYWMAFDVDVSGLTDGYAIHFDLYNTTDITEPLYGARTCKTYYTSGSKKGQCKTWNEASITGYTLKDTDVKEFAPFSHDAESGTSRKVPEPGTLLLLGSGLIGLAGFRMLRK